MKRSGRMLALAAMILAVVPAAHAGDGAHLQFRNAIRTLERVQDATANGDASAADLQSKLMIQIETDLRSAQQSDLQDVRNLDALAIFLFSGGNPNLAEKRLTSLNIAPESRALLDGALAYARSDKVNAIKHLGSLDLARLPPNLVGRVALVRAILISAEDSEAALALLGVAAAAMPGTLVEEAALRRCTSFAGKLLAIERLERCASRYSRRFQDSIYWPDFVDNLTLALIEVDYLKAGGSLPQLKSMVADLPSASHRKLLLAISKAAVGRGRLQLAISTAALALELPGASPADAARSKFYMGAAMIVGENVIAAKEMLEKVDRAWLDPSDGKLLDDALRLAMQITSRPDISDAQANASLAATERNDDQSSTYLNLLARAKIALADPPAPPN